MDEQTASQLLFLARDLANAKAAEDCAKAARIAVEEKIAGLVPGPEKGQKTVTLPDKSKITVERGFNYKADLVEIEKVFASEGESRYAPIKVKTTRELDVTGYEWYRENDPESFACLSQFVVATPKKVSVTLKAAK
ncbi:MAG: hypothetical protein WC551_09605 [Patescibacteria group bacterium]